MTIGNHIKSFYGQGIEAFDHQKGIQDVSQAIRLEVGYEQAEEGLEMMTVLAALAEDSKAGQIQAIIIGAWEEAYDVSIQPFVDFLIKNKSVFQNLKALYFAEMTIEENEISWIKQGDYGELWAAYPDLACFLIRGAEGLSLGDVQAAQLKKMVIETGGLEAKVLHQIAKAQLPALTHLELWLGDDNYGWDGSIEDVEAILYKSKFPQLKHLAVKNSIIQDDIVTSILNSDILKQLSCLDLSMGLMTDKGAEALLANAEQLSGLSILNVSENYLSNEMVKKLLALNMTVITGDQKEPDDDDDDYRYVSVAE